MSVDYNGLTRTSWTGTWSPTTNHPVALANEIRGGVHSITGLVGDQLTDISGQRLEEGMLVYVKNGYTGVDGDSFYQYSLLGGESRNPSTGYVPNNPGNWSKLTLGGGGSLTTLTDVTITSPVEGDRLEYNSTLGVWENVPAGTTDAALGGLIDVIITTPQDGDIVRYNSGTGQWENVTVAELTSQPAGTQRPWGYVHEQVALSDQWTIDHNLGTENVMTQIIDATGQVIIPDEINIIHLNTIQVRLNQPAGGKAFLVAFVV